MYLDIVRRLCLFLGEFRRYSEELLDVDLCAYSDAVIDDPWQQLNILTAYCEEPF